MCSLTLQRHEVGAQPAAGGRAVVEVVEGEEVGWDGSGVAALSGPGLQLAGCDGPVRVHGGGGAGNLQHHIRFLMDAFQIAGSIGTAVMTPSAQR